MVGSGGCAKYTHLNQRYNDTKNYGNKLEDANDNLVITPTVSK